MTLNGKHAVPFRQTNTKQHALFCKKLSIVKNRRSQFCGLHFGEMISLVLRVSMLERMRRRKFTFPAAFLCIFLKMRFKIKCRVQMHAEVFIACSGVDGRIID